jgi:hypothetical protein
MDIYQSMVDACKAQGIGSLPITSHACNCIGPQNGQPACPCAMRDVKVVDGRWVRVQDLGLVR